jgi:exopolysaccharide biosynthesis WecB/TagA/CpsF family protein
MPISQKAVAQSVKLLRHIRLVGNRRQLNGQVMQLAARRDTPTVVSWLNAHAFTMAHQDDELADNLLKSHFLFRDGIGVSTLLRLIDCYPGLNMNGTDFIPKIINLYQNKPVALLGTCEPYLSQAAEAVEKIGCKVVLRMDGFQEMEAYARQLTEHKVELVILGMGVPKQEKVAAHLLEMLPGPLLILNGGAIMDFMAGRFPRAPRLWRALRAEWLFRLLQEPRRLAKRYTVEAAAFLFYTARLIYLRKRKEF